MGISLLSLAFALLAGTEPTGPKPAAAAPAAAGPVVYRPTLSSFTQASSGGHAVLSWTLLPASQVAFVIVQRRSVDQTSWETVARRLVTEALTYQLGDASLLPGTYRLVTVDADGTPAFSRTLTIR